MTRPSTNPAPVAEPTQASDSLIIRAARFAERAHAGQKRKYTDAPYILHPGRVAARAALLPNATEEVVAAAWLHDVVEDCGVTVAALMVSFGPRVASLVAELTNTSKNERPDLNRARRKALDRSRLAGVSDVAKQLKMIDRIDNLHEMQGAPPDFIAVYVGESRMLADFLSCDATAILHGELLAACGELEALDAFASARVDAATRELRQALHHAIINIPHTYSLPKQPTEVTEMAVRAAYGHGHWDARHAAAELVLSHGRTAPR